MSGPSSLRPGIPLGFKVAAAGALLLLGTWVIAAGAWASAEQRRAEQRPAAESRRLREAVGASLRTQLATQPEALECAVHAALCSGESIAQFRKTRRVRKRTRPPDMRRLLQDELSASGLDAAWIREPDGEVSWRRGGIPARLPSPPIEGACVAQFDGGREALALCREVEVWADAQDPAVPAELMFAGALKVVDPAGPEGEWAVYLPGGVRAVASSKAWTAMELPGLLLGSSSPDDVRRLPASVAGRSMLVEASAIADVPAIVVARVPIAARLSARLLLSGRAGEATREWRFFLAVSGVMLLAGLVGFAWMAMSLGLAFRPLVGATRRLAADDLDIRLPVRRRDELGTLASALNDLASSLKEARRNIEVHARVAAWRDVARGIAHEVKNPLLPIRGTVENLLRWRREEPRRFDELFESRMATILEEVDNLARLAGTFSDFASLPAPVKAPVDLSALVRESARLHVSGASGVDLVDELAVNLPPIPVDAGQLRQVVGNLVKNAVEAMGAAGGRLFVASGTAPGRQWVSISDTGPGLPPEAAGRLFTPYVSTKKESGGTGLGLWLSYRIVVEHGGAIEATPRPGGGTTFTVALPAS
jgi:signal transduction histidine kinase